MKQRLQMLAGVRTTPEHIRPGGAHDAAVVIPLILKGDEYSVLFEVRQCGIRQGGEGRRNSLGVYGTGDVSGFPGFERVRIW